MHPQLGQKTDHHTSTKRQQSHAYTPTLSLPHKQLRGPNTPISDMTMRSRDSGITDVSVRKEARTWQGVVCMLLSTLRASPDHRKPRQSMRGAAGAAAHTEDVLTFLLHMHQTYTTERELTTYRSRTKKTPDPTIRELTRAPKNLPKLVL